MSHYFKLALLSSLICIKMHAALVLHGPTSLEHPTVADLVIEGPAFLNNITARNLTVHGPLHFNQIEVSGQLTVFGPMEGKEGKFKDVTVKSSLTAEHVIMTSLTAFGPVALYDFFIAGPTEIVGTLQAQKGFFKDVTAGSLDGCQSISFDKVKANNVVIIRGKEPEILNLADTRLTGNIIFPSKNGIIHRVNDQVFIEGKIDGGLIDPIKRGPVVPPAN